MIHTLRIAILFIVIGYSAISLACSRPKSMVFPHLELFWLKTVFTIFLPLIYLAVTLNSSDEIVMLTCIATIIPIVIVTIRFVIYVVSLPPEP